MNYKTLPVYEQKDRILAAFSQNQVVVVESPTGSGKTTQLPVILHEAGYTQNGIVGVTQPRRIAAISVSEFIAKQFGVLIPSIIGYKMRFEDRTNLSTKIKIMTDGILLQEMKLDPMLSKYSVIIVDEAHERSLNIDFILGLLKRVLEARPNFKVIVSSATINAEVFSAYFGDCPIVKIETQLFPVTVVWEPPVIENDNESILDKISVIIARIIGDRRDGDILVFLPGEKLIKDCMQKLASGQTKNKIHIVPLYARLGKDEQEKIFIPAPFGKKKVILATNIAETSVTINGITSVIDSGLAKLNFYNHKTYTSSLVQVPVSKASCNQRKGRAGRTGPGFCYRLFTREDYENRSLFTLEEIYRTDLSEVLLRMAELGVNDFEHFDFISKPPQRGIRGALDILNLLDALEPDRSLSKVGQLMCAFPLLPRLSRIIVEALLKYPDVIEDVIIAASFLSTLSPYILPPGEEMEARRAHHLFRDPLGDFVSYLKMFDAFLQAPNKTKYCSINYLDERTLLEIVRIKEQIELIVSDMGFPILRGGSREDYLCAVSRGLIQFVCAKYDRGVFTTLMSEKVTIHPGSVMFKESPEFMVAGEIVRTTRMYAMSVSPLQKNMLAKISPIIAEAFLQSKNVSQKKASSPGLPASKKQRDFTNSIKIADQVFEIATIKKRKKVVMPWPLFQQARDSALFDTSILHKSMIGVITVDKYKLLDGEKLDTILRIANWLNPITDLQNTWPKKEKYNSLENIEDLLKVLKHVLQITQWKQKSNELGFVTLFTNSASLYWFSVSRGFHTAIHESIASLESLADELVGNGSASTNAEHLNTVNTLYRKLSQFFA